MGLIRVLLALAVVDFHAVSLTNAPHAFGLPWANGQVAVQSFFVISGFYMALILTGKYAGRGALAFYQARLIRLYPAYWLVCIASIVVFVATSQRQSWLPLIQQEQWLTLAWLVVNNTLFLGQDLNFFFAPQLPAYLLVPQAWTLAIEVSFYVIAPWLVRQHNRTIVLLLLLSILARALLYRAGYNGDPWNSRLFPLELGWFLFGILAHRVYALIAPSVKDSGYGIFAIAIITVSIATFQATLGIPIDAGGGWGPIGQYTLPLLIAIALPFVFIATKDSHFDSLIGELSYPLYLCHVVVIYSLNPLAIGLFRTEIVMATSLLVAICIAVMMSPIERWRARMSSR